MKKVILKTLTIATLLAFISPIYANAAELKADKTEMTQGELIEVTVETEDPVELMQFDLKFDNQKYKYENVASDLDSTAARVIKDDKDGGTVRVSAFDLNEDKTNTVTLQFRAIDMGENIPSFSIDKDAVLELGEAGEDFGDKETTITVSKIGPAILDYPDDPNQDPSNGLGKDGKYVNDDGEEITELPQTGDTTKKAVGRFSRLGALINVIPYALADCDEYVSLKDDVQTQFTAAINPSNSGDIVTTGETIDIPDAQNVTVNHTFIVYGDVNKDGKVTTSDALAIHKGKDKEGNLFNDIQKEAADIKNDGIVNDDDARAVQAFVLKTRTTDTGTIISKYPVKTIEQKDFLQPAINADTKYSYTNVMLASFTATNGTRLTQELLEKATTITGPNGDVKKENISYQIEADGTEATMSLYVEEEGSYLVSVVIKGDEETVENGKVDLLVNHEVVVEKNKAITRIELTANNMVVGVQDREQINVKLYHSDYDINGKVIAGSEKLIDDPAVAANIIPQKASNSQLEAISILNSDGKEIKFDKDGNIISGQGDPVGYLAIKAKTITQKTTETVTIKADNSTYYGDHKKDTQVQLNVTINPFKGKTGLCVNGQPVKNGQTIPITIYEEEPSPKPSNVEFNDGDALVYTLLSISYGKGETVALGDVLSTSGSINQDRKGKIAIVENANPDSGNEMSVMGYVAKDDPNDSPFVNGNGIEKIAIAYSGKGELSKLSSGITIWYDEEVEGTDEVTRAHITLNVTVVPATTSRSINLLTDDNEEVPLLEEEEVDSNDVDTKVVDDNDNAEDPEKPAEEPAEGEEQGDGKPSGEELVEDDKDGEEGKEPLKIPTNGTTSDTTLSPIDIKKEEQVQ